MRTIANMVENLGDEFEFLIVTRDRDLGSLEAYFHVSIDQWNNIGKAKVFYASPTLFSLNRFKKLLNATPHDIIYLNSFFSPLFTASLLLLRRIGFIQTKAIIIAPRGEFSLGALHLKSIKKSIYIKIIKLFRLYDNLIWQASSEHEAQNIRDIMHFIAKDILIAPDLLPATVVQENINSQRKHNKVRKIHLQLVFLSRISPMKNLDYLLRILQKVKLPINFSLYGPLEDYEYWTECEKLIQKLPSNITVHYHGEVTPEEVSKAFIENDVFFFPTRGENFGHVIFESLAVGTCVVLSDQTPWTKDKQGAIEVFSLENSDAWVEAIERWANYSDEELVTLRQAALNYAREYIITSPAVEQNRELFQFAFNNISSKNTL